MATNDALKKWLKRQIDSLTNVKVCTFGQDPAVSDPVRKPDLVVHTWAGIHVHVHLMDEPTSVRTVRRIVDGATRVGVSSLFLVDLKLLPRNGEVVPVDKWYVAIHALIDARLYAYQSGAREPVIRQVHFQKTGKPGEVEAQYGPDIQIKQLRWYRNSVKSSLIRGFWMVADFGPDVTRKASQAEFSTWADYERARRGFGERAEQSSTAGSRHHQQESDAGEPSAPQPVKETRLESCYELLSVNREATRDEVKAAFRRLAFELHPDVSNLPRHVAEERFKMLSEAYEYIKTTRGWS